MELELAAGPHAPRQRHRRQELALGGVSVGPKRRQEQLSALDRLGVEVLGGDPLTTDPATLPALDVRAETVDGQATAIVVFARFGLPEIYELRLQWLPPALDAAAQAGLQSALVLGNLGIPQRPARRVFLGILLFGTATAAHFHASGPIISYSGPAEWSYRRFILHNARLCAAAGGVEAFCIGSEMRGLTSLRGGAHSFPAVTRLRHLPQFFLKFMDLVTQSCC